MKKLPAFPIFIITAVCLMSAGCSSKAKNEAAVKDTFTRFLEVIQKTDVDGLKSISVSSVRKEIEADPAALMKLQFIKAMTPAQFNISAVTVTSTNATIDASGEVEGQKVTAKIDLIKEKDGWKILKFQPTMEMDVSNMEMPVSLDTEPAGPPQPKLFEGGKKPTLHVRCEGHEGEVTRMRFTPNSKYLVSVSYDDFTIRTWDTKTGAQISCEKMDNRPQTIALTKTADKVYAGDVYNNITVRELDAQGKLGTPKTLVSGEAGSAIALSPDGKLIASVDWQKKINVFDTGTGKLVTTLKKSEKMRSIVFDAKGELLIGAGDKNEYVTWDTKTWKPLTKGIRVIAKEAQCMALSVSANNKYFASGHNDSSIVIYDLASRYEVQNYYVTDSSTWDVMLSTDGKLLATANGNFGYVWESATAKGLVELKGHKEMVTSVALSPDGTTVATGAKDKKIFLWRSGDAAAAETEPEAPKVEKNYSGPAIAPSGYQNLVANPSANDKFNGWKGMGDAEISADHSGNPHFSIKNSGYFYQDVPVTGAGGKYILVVCRAMSDRFDSDGNKTGFPYIFGEWKNKDNDSKIDGYLNGDTLIANVNASNVWGICYGIIQIPQESKAVRIFLQQANHGREQNGSAARFDDVAVYINDSESWAKSALHAYEKEIEALAKKTEAIVVATERLKKQEELKKTLSSTGIGAKLPSDIDVSKSLVGKKLADVQAVLGRPKAQMKSGKKITLLYPDREIYSDDGKTVTHDNR